MRRAPAVVVAVLLAALGARSARAQDFLAADEALSVGLVNASRAAVGDAALTRSDALDAMARAQAARMAAAGQIFHNPDLSADIAATGLDWVRVGENVGVGPDVPTVHAAFMASPGHRDNLLFAHYSLIGAGVAPGTGEKSGLIFVAHVFAEVVAAKPAVRRPARIAPAAATVAPRMRIVASAVHPMTTDAPPPSSTPNAVTGGVVDSAVVLPG
jgi:hypothetical protein